MKVSDTLRSKESTPSTVHHGTLLSQCAITVADAAFRRAQGAGGNELDADLHRARCRAE